MLKNILTLEGVTLLSKEEQRSIDGGKRVPGETCKATCNDGTLVTVATCDNAAVACSTSTGSASCKCDYPSPFEPPK